MSADFDHYLNSLICFILVIENVFDPTDFDQDASLILECSSRLREQCNKFGNVKKVVVYDKHIQGICQVFFSTPEEADMGKKQSFFYKNLFPLPPLGGWPISLKFYTFSQYWIEYLYPNF